MSGLVPDAGTALKFATGTRQAGVGLGEGVGVSTADPVGDGDGVSEGSASLDGALGAGGGDGVGGGGKYATVKIRDFCSQISPIERPQPEPRFAFERLNSVVKR